MFAVSKNDPRQIVCKRVLGMEGDTVEVRDGRHGELKVVKVICADTNSLSVHAIIKLHPCQACLTPPAYPSICPMNGLDLPAVAL